MKNYYYSFVVNLLANFHLVLYEKRIENGKTITGKMLVLAFIGKLLKTELKPYWKLNGFDPLMDLTANHRLNETVSIISTIKSVNDIRFMRMFSTIGSIDLDAYLNGHYTAIDVFDDFRNCLNSQEIKAILLEDGFTEQQIRAYGCVTKEIYEHLLYGGNYIALYRNIQHLLRMMNVYRKISEKVNTFMA